MGAHSPTSVVLCPLLRLLVQSPLLPRLVLTPVEQADRPNEAEGCIRLRRDAAWAVTEHIGGVEAHPAVVLSHWPRPMSSHKSLNATLRSLGSL